ncbi:hypothetical protein V6Z96_009671 [Aspergillus fumigatus]
MAGDFGGFALFLKVYAGGVIVVEVLVSAPKIGDGPGINQYAEELVGNNTVGVSNRNSAGDVDVSATAEYAVALVETVTVSITVSVTVTSSAKTALNTGE